jgi:hypothetical protein
MLKDESGTPFVPLVAPEAVKDSQGTDWQTLLNSKLEKTNIIAGDNITLSVSGNNITINSQAGGATTNVIDNLNQQTAGVGVLDAHQGYVLKGMIPGVQNSLTSTSTTDALSAYQGYLLSNRSVPSGGTTGQVLKKKSNTDNDVEWGSLPTLATVATTGAYSDLSGKPTIPTVINNVTSTSTTSALSANQGKLLNDKFSNYLLTSSVVNNLTSTSTTAPLSAAQGKALNDKVTKKGSFILLGKEAEPISWTATETWSKMPFTVELEKEGSTIVSSTTNGDLTISSGISSIYISTCITYDITISEDTYLFVRITKNGTPITKTITKILRWGQMKLDAVTSVTTGDIIRVEVYKDVAGTLSFFDYTRNFGAGRGNYVLLEVLK